MIYYYCTKVRDENGYVKGYCDVCTSERHEPGDVLTDWSGQRFEVSFELPKGEPK